MRRLLVVSILAALGFAALNPVGAHATGTLEPGGSNFDFYQLDQGQNGSCDREPYGVVNSFNNAPDEIRSELTQMYANGQRRLRIGIFHQHGPDSGTVMDSSGGNLSAQNQVNLADLLAAVRNTGYQEIEVSFNPIGAANPSSWSSWNAAQYQENLSLIEHVRTIVAASGVAYKLDLLNEGMPMAGQTIQLAYAQRLWSDYTNEFGKLDTVGFSMTVWIAGRAKEMSAVYGNSAPDVFDLHLYSDASGWNGTEYQQFVAAHQELAAEGYTQGWIIGEGYYNDDTAAQGIAAAIADTGQTVFYLTQWPLSRANTCNDNTVDVAPPLEFNNYQASGF